MKKLFYIGYVDAYNAIHAKELTEAEYRGDINHDDAFPNEAMLFGRFTFCCGTVIWSSEPTQDEKYAVESYFERNGMSIKLWDYPYLQQ